ncbi:hypothetical protein PPSIR1_05723 [Plesiocystis pacifica SIR-1]|uniref:Cellulose-binding domain protein n=1 Tax=Plesiocystis pacifica SIR-1 TaxID=391625 RepID=A6FXB7_9BACT|nr:DUF1588 domain-containing protein [Plesiocystis pacifica]EDM81941.1 hypothetical protein PPSIR1_05723 [Plesiocystis pacifica SIR-1]
MTLVAAPGCQGDDADGGGDDEVGEDNGEDADGTTDGTDEGTGEEGGDDFIPPHGGMRRMLDHQYVNSIGYMFGDEAQAVADPPGDLALHGYDAIGAAEIAPGLDLVELYETSALEIGDAVVANPGRLASFVPCVTESPGQACYTDIAQTLGHIAWRRPLTDAEVSEIVDIALEAEEWGEGDFNAGLKYELVRILLSPNFIYVKEVGVQDANEPEEFWLTGPEMVTRVSLLINGRIPSLATLESAEAGNYDSVDAIEDFARALLADPSAPDAISEFFGEYLDLRIPGKNLDAFPNYSEALADSMLQETDMLLRHVIWEADTDWRTFYDADFTFIDQNLADLYGMAAPEEPFGQVELPADQNRAGFLTQGTFLARNAHADGNSTTRRGHYIQERMLCFTIPPPPPDVNPNIPEIPEGEQMTLREVMEQIHLEEESCASCHKDMDPLGFVLENFDALGQWRTEDNGLPIDSVVDYGDWGTMSNGVDLATNVAMDPRTTQCLVNNIIRFGRGSLEDFNNESDEILELYADFETANFRVKELLVSFVTSELFRQVGEPK